MCVPCRYGGNDLLRKWAPWLVDLPCTNGSFAVGDGIHLGEAVHATLIHMNQVGGGGAPCLVHHTRRRKPVQPMARIGLGGNVQLAPLPKIVISTTTTTCSVMQIQVHPTGFVDPAHPTSVHQFLGENYAADTDTQIPTQRSTDT